MQGYKNQDFSVVVKTSPWHRSNNWSIHPFLSGKYQCHIVTYYVHCEPGRLDSISQSQVLGKACIPSPGSCPGNKLVIHQAW